MRKIVPIDWQQMMEIAEPSQAVLTDFPTIDSQAIVALVVDATVFACEPLAPFNSRPGK